MFIKIRKSPIKYLNNALLTDFKNISVFSKNYFKNQFISTNLKSFTIWFQYKLPQLNMLRSVVVYAP